MNWKVKFFDYPLQFKIHEKEYMEIINDTLTRGAYILGEELQRFENNLAQFLCCKYAIGVSNCTDALLLSLKAAGVGPGDEVISVSHTFVATIEAIKFLGAMPVLIDIADDHTMNVDLVEAHLTDKTKAILPVQLNGTICKGIEKLVDIAGKNNLVIIEDAAQALGATYKGRHAGTFGLAGCFSFYPAKLLGTFGDAGAVVTNDKEFADKVRLLSNHGRAGNDVALWGLNCRMDNLHAAILDYKLKKLPEWVARRREIASLYYAGLSSLGELRLPSPPANNHVYFDVYQNYEIEAEDRDGLKEHLNDSGIEVMLQWGGKGVHQFHALGLGHYNLPRTEKLFQNYMMLPLYPELKNVQIECIIESIHKFYSV